MAQTQLSVTTILQVAKIAQGYAAIDRAKKSTLYGGFIPNLLPEKIYLIRRSIQYQYDKNQFNTTLRGTSNYLWSLLGVYGIRGLNALGIGGSVIIDTSGGQVISVVDDKVQLVVGDNSQSIPNTIPAPTVGGFAITLPYQIVPKSEIIFYQGVDVKLNPSNDFNYIASYGTSSTTYTFYNNTTDLASFTNGFGFEFNFDRIVATSSGGGTSVFNALQAINLVVPTSGNALIVSQLGTFIAAIQSNISYNNSQIIQTGTSLDWSAVGGVFAGEIITVFYYPPLT